jgi:hypothetical protein
VILRVALRVLTADAYIAGLISYGLDGREASHPFAEYQQGNERWMQEIWLLQTVALAKERQLNSLPLIIFEASFFVHWIN